MEKATLGEKIFQSLNTLVLVLITFTTLSPLLYTLALSLSSDKYISGGLVKLWPRGFNIDAYIKILKDNEIPNALLNSLIITVIGTLINMLMTTVTAYPLSKKDLIGRKSITLFIVFTMWFSGGIIPQFVLLNALHMTNTFFSVWMLTIINVFNLIIMRKSFEDIPVEMDEAAIIDGASYIQVFTKIALPLSKATLAALTLFYAVYHWNSFICAVMFISNRKVWPIQAILRDIIVSNEMQSIMYEDLSYDKSTVPTRALQSATIIVATLPILVVYPFLQKHFAKGVMLGSLKG